MQNLQRFKDLLLCIINNSDTLNEYSCNNNDNSLQNIPSFCSNKIEFVFSKILYTRQSSQETKIYCASCYKVGDVLMFITMVFFRIHI
jgi:hypothetical protein